MAGSPVRTAQDWRATVKGLLKGELKKRNLSYAELEAKLAAIGVDEDDRNIANKISRGTFTAVFFYAMLGRDRLSHSSSR